MTECEPSGLNALLDRYEAEGSNAVRRLLHHLAATGGAAFLTEMRNLVVERPVSDGLKFALKLLDREEIVKIILGIYLRSKEEAIALTKKLVECDPRFDTALLDYIREQQIAERSENAVLAILDVLDGVSEGDKLVLNVYRLLKHPSAKLRSKAASFIARRRPRLPWVTDLSNEPDARVRANVIESLIGIQADFVAPLLWKHVNDENNRVAGNALAGLYELGEARSVQLIEDMAKHELSAFRATAAWVMGQARDVRFAAFSATLLSDTDARVRTQALRSLGRIKDSLKEAQPEGSLQVTVMKRRPAAGGQSLFLTVASESSAMVRKIPGTRFVLKAGGKYVKNYQVVEQQIDDALHIAVVAFLPADGGDPVSRECEQAVERCSGSGRAVDKIKLSTLNHDAQLRCVQEDEPAAVAAIREALIDVAFGNPNLHVIAVGACAGTHALDAIMAAARQSGTHVHVVALSPEWKTASIKSRIEERDGYLLAVDKADAVPKACLECYSGIQHHYELTWRDGEGAIELEVRCPEGVGSAAYTD